MGLGTQTPALRQWFGRMPKAIRLPTTSPCTHAAEETDSDLRVAMGAFRSIQRVGAPLKVGWARSEGKAFWVRVCTKGRSLATVLRGDIRTFALIRADCRLLKWWLADPRKGERTRALMIFVERFLMVVFDLQRTA